MKWKNIPQLFRKLSNFILVALTFVATAVQGQIPQGVPKPQNNDPVAFDSLSDLIIYIILPVVLIVIYLIILYRRRKKRRQEDNESSEWEKRHRP